MSTRDCKAVCAPSMRDRSCKHPGRRPAVLFQWQEQLRDRLMLRHLREETQPLAIDREVACFLAAGRKPVAIKIERGGLQIVGVADAAQRPPGISPALISSPFASIGWS